jgi:hypothetical protein
MADRSFEMELDRLFAEAPAFPDSDLFATRVETRLDRGWTFRRLLIGGLGVAGGLIGGAQIIGSGLLSKLSQVGERSNHMVSSGLGDLTADHILPGGLPINGEVLWMSAALAVLAIGLVATRAIKDI